MSSPRRSRFAVRARTILATTIACFAVLQFGLAAAIELWLPQLRDPLYGDKLNQLKSQLAAAPADAPLVVMLGSSRAIHGLDAGRFERELARRQGHPVAAYNFGLPGAGPFTELVCLERLLAEGIRPDLALVEVLPPMLAGQTPSFDLGQYPADRLWRRELPLVERYTKAIFPEQQLASDWRRGWCAPFYSHRFAIMRAVCPAFVPPEGRGHLFAEFDAHGWNVMPAEVRTSQRYQSALETARREYASLLANFKLGGASCQALREMLTICRREGIATALVLMPEGEDFRSWYPQAADNEINSFLADLGRQFSIPVIDGRRWVEDANFLDSHHLLAPGAERFSHSLAQHSPFPIAARRSAKPESSATRPSQRR